MDEDLHDTAEKIAAAMRECVPFVGLRSGTKRVMIVPACVYHGSRAEVFFALEDSACMFYDGTYALTEFELVKRGFPFDFSEVFAEVMADAFLSLSGAKAPPTETRPGLSAPSSEPKPEPQNA